MLFKLSYTSSIQANNDNLTTTKQTTTYNETVNTYMTGTIVYYALGSDHISHAAVAWHTAPTNATLRKMSPAVLTAGSVQDKVCKDTSLRPRACWHQRLRARLCAGHSVNVCVRACVRVSALDAQKRHGAIRCIRVTTTMSGSPPVSKVMMTTPGKTPESHMMGMAATTVCNGMQAWNWLPLRVQLQAVNMIQI